MPGGPSQRQGQGGHQKPNTNRNGVQNNANLANNHAYRVHMQMPNGQYQYRHPGTMHRADQRQAFMYKGYSQNFNRPNPNGFLQHGSFQGHNPSQQHQQHQHQQQYQHHGHGRKRGHGHNQGGHGNPGQQNGGHGNSGHQGKGHGNPSQQGGGHGKSSHQGGGHGNPRNSGHGEHPSQTNGHGHGHQQHGHQQHGHQIPFSHAHHMYHPNMFTLPPQEHPQRPIQNGQGRGQGGRPRGPLPPGRGRGQQQGPGVGGHMQFNMPGQMHPHPFRPAIGTVIGMHGPGRPQIGQQGSGQTQNQIAPQPNSRQGPPMHSVYRPNYHSVFGAADIGGGLRPNQPRDTPRSHLAGPDQTRTVNVHPNSPATQPQPATRMSPLAHAIPQPQQHRSPLAGPQPMPSRGRPMSVIGSQRPAHGFSHRYHPVPLGAPVAKGSRHKGLPITDPETGEEIALSPKKSIPAPKTSKPLVVPGATARQSQALDIYSPPESPQKDVITTQSTRKPIISDFDESLKSFSTFAIEPDQEPEESEAEAPRKSKFSFARKDSVADSKEISSEVPTEPVFDEASVAVSVPVEVPAVVTVPVEEPEQDESEQSDELLEVEKENDDVIADHSTIEKESEAVKVDTTTATEIIKWGREALLAFKSKCNYVSKDFPSWASELELKSAYPMHHGSRRGMKQLRGPAVVRNITARQDRYSKPQSKRTNNGNNSHHNQNSHHHNNHHNKKGGSGRYGQQRPDKPIPGLEITPLAKTTNAWKPGQGEEEPLGPIKKKIQGIINKLALDKFASLSSQLIKFINEQFLSRHSYVSLIGASVTIIFEQAIHEPNFAKMYAELCLLLAQRLQEESGELPSKKTHPRKTAFVKTLVQACETEFRKGIQRPTREGKSEEDIAIEEIRQKKRFLGNIKFIGELFKIQMIRERSMHDCVKQLLDNIQTPQESDLEAVCKLLTTIGSTLDHKKAKNHVNTYFERLQQVANNKTQRLPSRICFMCQNLIDLRRDNWVPRIKENEAKTIAEIKKDHVKERGPMRHSGDFGFQAGARGNLRGGGGKGKAVDRYANLSSHGKSRSGSGTHRGTDKRGSQDSRNRDHDRNRDRRDSRDDRDYDRNRRADNRRDRRGDDRRRSSRDDPRDYGRRDHRGGHSRTGTGNGRRDNRSDSRISPSLRPRTPEIRSPGLGTKSRSPSITSSSVPSSSATVVPPLSLDTDILNKQIESLILEYAVNRDFAEACQCVKELNGDFSLVVSKACDVYANHRKEAEKPLIASLLVDLCLKGRLLDKAHFSQGLKVCFATLDEVAMDFPHAPKIVGDLIGVWVANAIVSLPQLIKMLTSREVDDMLKDPSLVDAVIAHVLNTVKKVKDEKSAINLWKQAQQNGSPIRSVEVWASKYNITFLLPRIDSDVERRLKAMLQDQSQRGQWEKLIKSSISPEIVSSVLFLRFLLRTVLSICMTKAKSCSQIPEEKSSFGRYVPLLRAFVSREEHQIACMDEANAVFVKQKTPQGLIVRIFDLLYSNQILDAKTSEKWKRTAMSSKFMALRSLEGFYSQIRS